MSSKPSPAAIRKRRKELAAEITSANPTASMDVKPAVFKPQVADLRAEVAVRFENLQPAGWNSKKCLRYLRIEPTPPPTPPPTTPVDNLASTAADAAASTGADAATISIDIDDDDAMSASELEGDSSSSTQGKGKAKAKTKVAPSEYFTAADHFRLIEVMLSLKDEFLLMNKAWDRLAKDTKAGPSATFFINSSQLYNAASFQPANRYPSNLLLVDADPSKARITVTPKVFSKKFGDMLSAYNVCRVNWGASGEGAGNAALLGADEVDEDEDKTEDDEGIRATGSDFANFIGKKSYLLYLDLVQSGCGDFINAISAQLPVELRASAEAAPRDVRGAAAAAGTSRGSKDSELISALQNIAGGEITVSISSPQRKVLDAKRRKIDHQADSAETAAWGSRFEQLSQVETQVSQMEEGNAMYEKLCTRRDKLRASL